MIKEIITKDYPSIEKVEGDDIIKMSYIVNYMLTKEFIADDDAFRIYYILIKKGLIIDLDKEEINILQKKAKLTSTLINVNRDIQIIKRCVNQLITKMQQSNGILKDIMNGVKFNTFHGVLISKIVPVIDSFMKNRFLMTGADMEINKMEMVNRLGYLAKFFGLNTLSFFNVRLISFNKFMSYQINGQIEYYLSCITTVNNKIKNILEIYDRYHKLNNCENELRLIYKKMIHIN